MPWYKTGTIAVSGTTVTGTGTNWTDAKQGIGPGQALLVPAAGTVKMYEIKSVDSATKLTLVSSAGTIAAGQAYAIMSFYADSIPDFARRLSAQLSYYQSQMDGWQNIMTGSGTITMTAPDGTTVNISSFAKLTADMNTLSAVANAALPLKGNIGSGKDLNNFGPTSDYIGVWGISTGTDTSGLVNAPEVVGAFLEVIPYGYYGCTQRYTTRYGSVYMRMLNSSWSASTPTWSDWYRVGDQPVQGYVTGD